MANVLGQAKSAVQSTVKKAMDNITGSDNLPKDARSIFQHMMSTASEANAKSNARSIITLSNLQMVSGMPPMGDNIVDPPPFLDTGNSSSDKMLGTTRSYSGAFGTGLAGMDYIERNIVGGNFLILVPLELKPSIMGNLKSAISSTISKETLNSLQGRLSVADYGLESAVATRRYWRSYTMLLKAAAISLGVDVNSGAYTSSALKDMLPTHIYDGIVENTKQVKAFNFFDTEVKNNYDTTKKYGTHNIMDNIKDKFSEAVASGVSKVASSGLFPSENSTEYAGNVEPTDILALVSGTSYINLMKYMTNMDSDVTKNEKLPIISFFINGTVERNYSSSATIEESKVAKHTTDMLRKSSDAIQVGENLNDMMDYMTELAYHGVGGKTASFALSNTSIPKVISDMSSDFSYSVKISDKSIGSDSVSLLRIQDTWAKIAPFITPVSDGSQNTVVPNSPLYCSAFVKGIMNVPRGAITSVQISTNPQFQTSEGIPTEIDIVLNIQPLLCISTMPDFGRFFSNTDETSLVAAMYNPMSAFNIIATMCGYNTVLTKYPYSLFDFFVKGNISSIYQSFQGIGNYVHTAMNDFVASQSSNFGSRFIVGK